jgi:hypothetical protein
MSNIKQGDVIIPVNVGKKEWECLERFSVQCRQIELEDFMFMSVFETVDQVNIYLYKHRMTRHYLNLDADLNCYKYQGNDGYLQIVKDNAIKYVFSVDF